jgi:hypothetical protein
MQVEVGGDAEDTMPTLVRFAVYFRLPAVNFILPSPNINSRYGEPHVKLLCFSVSWHQ